MSHTCHANYCKAACAPEKLMCLRHWRMVPADAQRRVLGAYRPGQCRDMRPSQEWFDAAQLAIALVAKAEGKGTSIRQRQLLEEYTTTGGKDG